MTLFVVGAIVVGLLYSRPGLFRPAAWAAQALGWLLLAMGVLASVKGQLHAPWVGIVEGFLIAVGLIVAGQRSGPWMRGRSVERWAKRYFGSGGSPLSDPVTSEEGT